MRKKERYLTVGDILVSPEIITHYFACDLDACRGACCVEGEEGAPVSEEEKPVLLETLPRVMDQLPPDNVDYMLSHGVLYSPVPDSWATMIVDGGRCVFTSCGPGECCRCVFEQSYRAGQQDRFLKPISCHLYPIRMRHTDAGQTLLYYDVWSPLCDAAVERGEREGVRIYQFAREALTRAFGKKWYHWLEEEAREYISNHE